MSAIPSLARLSMLRDAPLPHNTGVKKNSRWQKVKAASKAAPKLRKGIKKKPLQANLLEVHTKMNKGWCEGYLYIEKVKQILAAEDVNADITREVITFMMRDCVDGLIDDENRRMFTSNIGYHVDGSTLMVNRNIAANEDIDTRWPVNITAVVSLGELASASAVHDSISYWIAFSSDDESVKLDTITFPPTCFVVDETVDALCDTTQMLATQMRKNRDDCSPPSSGGGGGSSRARSPRSSMGSLPSSP